MKKIILLAGFLGCIGFTAFGQGYKNYPGHELSNEDLIDIYLHKSRQQKTAGYIALIGGSAVTAVSVSVAKESDPFLATNSPIRLVGELGILTALSSIPLFISSVNNKHKARLLIKNETTGYKLINKNVFVPAISLQIAFN